MKTANISFNVQAVQTGASDKISMTKDKSFEKIISKNMDRSSNGSRQTNSGKMNPAKEIKDGFDSHKITVKTEKNAMDMQEKVPLEEISQQVTALLQNVFGLSKEDVEDLLKELDMIPLDLLVTAAGLQEGQMIGNAENLKAFVLEVHGIEDPSAMLISDELTQEWTQITQGISDILEQISGVSEDSQEMQNFLQNLSETLDNFKNVSEKMDVKVTDEQLQKEDAAVVASVISEEESIPITVEVSDEAGQQGSFENHSDMSSQTSVEQEAPLPVFVEKLTQAFEPNAETAEVPQVSMQEIVDQVVNHIRIRVLPQTTSMELQLNPESLGRVHLAVSSNQGVATATLTVQNEMAKEALESQLLVLRENLESQGLKVESVEVNVSHFGFKNQEDSNNHNFEQRKNSSRRFRVNAGETALDSQEVSEEDGQEQQQGDSTVDYTA